MNLRAKVLHGIFWTGGARLLSQVFTWGITIVVIRTLTPADYGLLAMATMFVSFLGYLAGGGLGEAVVQSSDLDEGKLRQIFGAVILIDTILFGVLVAAAPAIAHFFSEDRLVVIIRVLALQFLLLMFTVIPVALLSRALDFKRQSIVEFISTACGSVAMLALALGGMGVWALVFGVLLNVSVKAIGMNLIAPFLRRPVFSLNGLRSYVVFGGQFTGTKLLWFVYTQADIFIIGKLLGKELLGIYSVAMHLASLPVQKLSSVFNQVAFPAFAQVQDSPEQIRAHLLKAVRILSLVSFALLWGISSIAPEIVAVLLGPRWGEATLPMQLLPLVMPLTMLSPLFNSVFQGIGHGGVVFRNVLTACVVMPALFLLGARWGLLGLSLAWICGFPLVFLANLQRMLPRLGMNLRPVLITIAVPALAAAGMYAGVSVVRELLVGTVPTPVLMLILIATGAACYGAMTLATNRQGIREVRGLFGRESAEIKGG